MSQTDLDSLGLSDEEYEELEYRSHSPSEKRPEDNFPKGCFFVILLIIIIMLFFKLLGVNQGIPIKP